MPVPGPNAAPEFRVTATRCSFSRLLLKTPALDQRRAVAAARDGVVAVDDAVRDNKELRLVIGEVEHVEAVGHCRQLVPG